MKGVHHCDISCRVLGPVAFTQQSLARYGTVVAVPYNPDNSLQRAWQVTLRQQ